MHRKTGWAQTRTVRKDHDGLDNVDEFFDSDGEQEQSDAPIRSAQNRRASSRRQSLAVSRRSAVDADDLGDPEDDSRFFDESFDSPAAAAGSTAFISRPKVVRTPSSHARAPSRANTNRSIREEEQDSDPDAEYSPEQHSLHRGQNRPQPLSYRSAPNSARRVGAGSGPNAGDPRTPAGMPVVVYGDYAAGYDYMHEDADPRPRRQRQQRKSMMVAAASGFRHARASMAVPMAGSVPLVPMLVDSNAAPGAVYDDNALHRRASRRSRAPVPLSAVPPRRIQSYSHSPYTHYARDDSDYIDPYTAQRIQNGMDEPYDYALVEEEAINRRHQKSVQQQNQQQKMSRQSRIYSSSRHHHQENDSDREYDRREEENSSRMHGDGASSRSRESERTKQSEYRYSTHRREQGSRKSTHRQTETVKNSYQQSEHEVDIKPVHRSRHPTPQPLQPVNSSSDDIPSPKKRSAQLTNTVAQTPQLSPRSSQKRQQEQNGADALAEVKNEPQTNVIIPRPLSNESSLSIVQPESHTDATVNAIDPANTSAPAAEPAENGLNERSHTTMELPADNNNFDYPPDAYADDPVDFDARDHASVNNDHHNPSVPGSSDQNKTVKSRSSKKHKSDAQSTPSRGRSGSSSTKRRSEAADESDDASGDDGRETDVDRRNERLTTTLRKQTTSSHSKAQRGHRQKKQEQLQTYQETEGEIHDDDGTNDDEIKSEAENSERVAYGSDAIEGSDDGAAAVKKGKRSAKTTSRKAVKFSRTQTEKSVTGKRKRGPLSKELSGLGVSSSSQDERGDDDEDDKKDEMEDENGREATSGIRRSRRTKVPPVAYWRNERVVYGRRVSGIGAVPTAIKEVIRIPSDDERAPPIVARRSRPVERSKKVDQPPVPQEIAVRNFVSKVEELKQVVVTPDMLNPRTTGAGDYRFQKVFGEGEFMASGVLVLPKGAKKPRKNSFMSAMVFVVLSGQADVEINNTRFTAAQSTQFFVPRDNYYSIENNSGKETRIFFCHGKEIAGGLSHA